MLKPKARSMRGRPYASYFLVTVVAGLAGCSSEPPPKQAVALDKIQGKALIIPAETTALDQSMNAGGPTVYLLDGTNRYRLFFNKAFPVKDGQEYVAEGVYAQKAIDAIGDPDGGKNGYPLESSCRRVVTMAWPGLAFDVVDSDVNSLLAKVKRFPARAVFLVTKLDAAPTTGDAAKKEDADDKDSPKVTVAADKQRGLLIDGPASFPAPLWAPEGGTARCKVVIDQKGKVAELKSGAQFCEAVPWAQFRYKPAMKGSQPMGVETEVEVRFDPRK